MIAVMDWIAPDIDQIGRGMRTIRGARTGMTGDWRAAASSAPYDHCLSKSLSNFETKWSCFSTVEVYNTYNSTMIRSPSMYSLEPFGFISESSTCRE